LRQVATGDLAILAGRIEGAVQSLADPAQVEESMATARTEAARQIATVEAQMVEARAAQRKAEARMVEAEEVAETLSEQVEGLEAERDALTIRVAQAGAGIETMRREAVEAGRRLKAEHEAELERVRGEAATRVAEAEEVRARALGRADLLAADLQVTEFEAPEMVERAVADLTARLGERHLAELQVREARYEAELARCEAQCHTANEIARERLAEVDRLVGQLAAAEHHMAGVRMPESEGG